MENARDNETWLRDLRAGSPQRDAALADLHELLSDALPRAVSRWLRPGTPGSAFFIEYIIQETFSRVLGGLGSFKGSSRFPIWVYKIAARVVLREVRHGDWQEVLSERPEADNELESGLSPFVSPEPLPESVLKRAGILQHLQELFTKELTSQQRAAMKAVYVQGDSIEEMARQRGASRSDMYKQLHANRLRLKRLLEQEGLDPKALRGMFAPDQKHTDRLPADEKSMKSVFDWFKRRFRKWYQLDATMKKILHSLELTEEQEATCDEVYAALDEFAGAVRRGENVDIKMPLIRRHLELCPDCRAEYETLLKMLRTA
jgi:RNA polymerase sigma factor (sigma-70 family)